LSFDFTEALKTLNESYSGKAADVWQLGVTLYALVFGFVPFHDTSIVTLYYKIQHEPLKFPKQSTTTISPLLEDLITRMLKKDPAERITIPEIKVMNHY
jgi:[calcium/calmodulin-dependent protein kinase] kinase